ALLADVLEQARAHRAAEHRVQHVTGEALVVALREGRRAQADVALLEILLADDDAAPFGGTGPVHGRARYLDAAERLANQRGDSLVLQVARRRDDEVRGDVGVGEIAGEGLLGQRLDGRGNAENWPAERVPAPVVLGEDRGDEGAGRVRAHDGLLRDDT